MKRTFHISNRVDIPKPGQPTAGGLDEAIADPVVGYENVRFGWSGDLVDDATESLDDLVNVTRIGHTTYITYPMRRTEFDHFYNKVANGVLWPAFHYREDIAKSGFADPMIKEAVENYYKVNREVAELAKKYIKTDDTVIVHDYHFIPMGKYLTVDNPVGHFFHIPMVNADFLENFDRDLQLFFYDLLDHHHHFDFVGLQTKRDVEALRSVIGNDLNGKDVPFFETEIFSSKPQENGRLTRFGAFPVSGNASKYTALATQFYNHGDVTRYIARNAGGQIDLLSVERRDYSKGIVPKVNAVGNWLHNYGRDGRRIHLVQIAPKGREEVRAYQDESMKIETSVEAVNEIFGKIVHLDPNKMARGHHLALARRASAIIVTPTRDGMNLYVSEAAAAQIGRDDPAPVIVSRYAGIASVFRNAAILVDPLRPGDIARSIERAKRMGKQERQDIQGRAEKVMEFFTNTRWQSSLIEATQNAATHRLTA